MTDKAEERAREFKGIPPATEDDLKLDLVGEYRRPAGSRRSVIRLAHHHQQEAERRVDPLDPDFKIALAYEERISTLEAALRDARVTIQRTEAEERAREYANEKWGDSNLGASAEEDWLTGAKWGQANPSLAAVARVLREAAEQANPSPAAVARVLKEAATVLIEDCRKTNSQAHNDGTCQCEYDAAIIEAMIPESER